jgi:hypothetical protein
VRHTRRPYLTPRRPCAQLQPEPLPPLQAATRPPLAWANRVRIAAEVAAALAFLHSSPEPIIHMDLKPANVLLSRWELAWVLDQPLFQLTWVLQQRRSSWHGMPLLPRLRGAVHQLLALGLPSCPIALPSRQAGRSEAEGCAESSWPSDPPASHLPPAPPFAGRW